MEERVKSALDQLDTLHADLSETEIWSVIDARFALATDDELRALMGYCQALLAQRESRPRD